MKLQLLIGAIISLIFLYFSISGVHLDELLDLLSHTHWIYILPIIAFILLGFLLRSLRWHFLLRSIKHISIYRLWSLETVGYAISNIYPARLGEFVRAYMLGKYETISGFQTFASIVIERILDGITVLLLFAFILLSFKLPGKADRINIKYLGHISLPQLGFLALSFYLLLILFLIWAYIDRNRAMRMVRAFFGILPLRFREKPVHLIEQFINGLSIIKQPTNLFIALFLSIVLWFSIIYSADLTFRAHAKRHIWLASLLCLKLGYSAACSHINGSCSTWEYWNCPVWLHPCIKHIQY